MGVEPDNLAGHSAHVPDGDGRGPVSVLETEEWLAELGRLIGRRAQESDAVRRALGQQLLDAGAGHALAARLQAIVREMQQVAGELEARNTALATANWQLEQRVAERTAALHAALDAKRESDARFRRVTEGVPHLVWASHPEGRWLYANRQWLAYTGQTEAEALGLGWLDSVHPEDRVRFMDAWHRASRHGEPIFVEHRLRTATGEWRWFETQALPSCGLPGDTLQWVGVSTDVHARKLAEQALHEVSAADASPDGVRSSEGVPSS